MSSDPYLPSSPLLPIGVALIGLSAQALEHADAVRSVEGLAVVMLCDSDPAQIERARQRLGDSIPATSSLDEAMACPGVQLAVVVLPHDQHRRAIEAAARHGVHVLKEKPLGRTLREALEIRDLAESAGIIVHTGVQRRFHATYAWLREALQRAASEGDMPIAASLDITIVRSRLPGVATTWRDHPTRAGGGILVDLGYHAVDLLHFLLGPMELLSCTLGRDGLPCQREDLETWAFVQARAGAAWVSLRVGVGETKQERIRVDMHDGSWIAGRDKVHWVPRGETPRERFSADQSWSMTQRHQIAAVATAVRDIQGEARSGEGETGSRAGATVDPIAQGATAIFIDQCYAQAASLAFAAGALR